jgi:hypothetical protein
VKGINGGLLAATETIRLIASVSHIETFFLFEWHCPQEGAEVPPLTPHQMWNLSDAPMEFLVISQPKSRDDRVFVAAPSDGGE